jgi:hypothetical protein
LAQLISLFQTPAAGGAQAAPATQGTSSPGVGTPTAEGAFRQLLLQALGGGTPVQVPSKLPQPPASLPQASASLPQAPASLPQPSASLPQPLASLPQAPASLPQALETARKMAAMPLQVMASVLTVAEPQAEVTGEERAPEAAADVEPEQPQPVAAAPPGDAAAAAIALMAALAAQPAPQGATTQPAASTVPTTTAGTAPVAQLPTEGSDSQVEAFARQAARLLTGSQDAQAPGAREGKPEAGPRFGDLVKLVAQAEAGSQQTPAQPVTQNPSPDGQAHQGQSQAQEHAQAPVHAAAPGREHAQGRPFHCAIGETPAQTPAEAEESITKAAAHETQPPAPATAPPPGASATEVNASETLDRPPRPTVDSDQVVRQVSRFVKVMVDGQQSEVRMQLHPEHLGTVAVKLILGDGVMKASLVTQDAAVKAAIEANLDQLKSRLADQGITVEQVHVTVGGDGAFSQPRQSSHGEQRHGAPQHGRSPAWQGAQQADDPPTPRRATAGRWASGSTGGRFNSLA